MKIKVLTVLFAILSLTSCKNDTKKADDEVKENVTKDDFFRIAFKLKVAKDDNMHLYYTVDGSINFQEDKSVWMPVKGSDKEQEIVFTLPEGIVPSTVRIDFGFGKNELQSDIDLKEFKLSYFGKQQSVKGLDILKYFIPFKGYTIIPAGSTILQRATKGQASGPILYPQAPLAVMINKLSGGASPE